MSLATFWVLADSAAAGIAILIAAITGACLGIRAARRAALDERDEQRARIGTEDG
jgi:hypothetical protein